MVPWIGKRGEWRDNSADTRQEYWSRTLEEAGLDCLLPSAASTLSVPLPPTPLPHQSPERTAQHGMNIQHLPKLPIFSRTNETLSVLEGFLLLFLFDTYQLLSPPVSVVYDFIRRNVFPVHTSVTCLLAQSLELFPSFGF